MKKNKKITILGNCHITVFGFRSELIERLVAAGYDVLTVFSNDQFGKSVDGYESGKKYGCRFVDIPMNRRGKNPLQDLLLLYRYYSLIKNEQPDVVLAYTAKCNIYGGIVCRLLNIPFYPNITGVGKGWQDAGMIRLIVVFLYRLALKDVACVFFQNEQDRQLFIDNRIRFRASTVLPGSGVNLQKYTSLAFPKGRPVVFLYIARVMKAKGIEQFFDAASALKRKYCDISFHICGFCEEDYSERIDDLQRKGIIAYHGLVSNVIPFLQNSHCVVLPSFHPEGISNVLLEAAACARPIITTDRVGCRETVDDGVTGFLVKERDSSDLIEKMEQFLLLSDDEKEEMGRKGRTKVEQSFDRQIVVNAYMNQLAGVN